MNPYQIGIELSDPVEHSRTIQRIDQLQTQLLEDLEILNQRIENIVELYYENRSTAGLIPDAVSLNESAAAVEQDAAA